jgi:hypothetical protein
LDPFPKGPFNWVKPSEWIPSVENRLNEFLMPHLLNLVLQDNPKYVYEASKTSDIRTLNELKTLLGLPTSRVFNLGAVTS